VLHDYTEAEQLSRHIWLVGHSYPTRWLQDLREPLDPRHPVRHNIWTSVLEVIQEVAYTRGSGRRIDTAKLFVCNAAAKQQPGAKPDWDYNGQILPARIALFRNRLQTYQPPIVLTFGADVFDFMSRALATAPNGGCGSFRRAPLSAAGLGAEFRRAANSFNPDQVNVFPLLHRSIAGGHWVSAHKAFTGQDHGDYFLTVGSELGRLLVEHAARLDVWHNPPN